MPLWPVYRDSRGDRGPSPKLFVILEETRGEEARGKFRDDDRWWKEDPPNLASSITGNNPSQPGTMETIH